MKRKIEEIIDRNTEGNYLITTEDREQMVSEILDAVGQSEQLVCNECGKDKPENLNYCKCYEGVTWIKKQTNTPDVSWRSEQLAAFAEWLSEHNMFDENLTYKEFAERFLSR